MVKVGQTLHMEGQYVPLDELDVLYFTQIHQYGHNWWHGAGGSQGPRSPPHSALRQHPEATPITLDHANEIQ